LNAADRSLNLKYNPLKVSHRTQKAVPKYKFSLSSLRNLFGGEYEIEIFEDKVRIVKEI